MANYYLRGYEPPQGVSNKDQVRSMQQQLGVTADGIWGPKTQAAYQQSSGGGGSAYPNSQFDQYYNQISASLSAPTMSYNAPSKADLSKEIAAYLRPSYDKAIGMRKEQTGVNRAGIDVDAASRGMGASTWVTDAKQREDKYEASDISNMESDYNASLAQSVLDQYNQHMANKMQVDMHNANLTAQYEQMAYERAAQMYQMMQPQYASYGPGRRPPKSNPAEELVRPTLNRMTDDKLAAFNAFSQMTRDKNYAPPSNKLSTGANKILSDLMKQSGVGRNVGGGLYGFTR